MSIQFKHSAIALVFTLAFSTSAFSLDTEDIMSKETMDKLSSIKAKLGNAAFNKEARSKSMMEKIDTNNDHTVSSVEYMNYYGEIFDALDENADNSIDEKEWGGNKENRDLKIASKSYSRELRNKSTMELMDTDDDRIVSRDEFVDFQQAIFENMDKKGTGNIKY